MPEVHVPTGGTEDHTLKGTELGAFKDPRNVAESLLRFAREREPR